MNEYTNLNENIDDTTAFTTSDSDLTLPILIKAVGVGGGGNNAVNHMFRSGLKDVSFVNINTDAQCLKNSPVPVKLVLGNGTGAGNKPEVARQFAEDAVEEINRLFDDTTQMVFITAGMGGGTGTGAGPVVARVAKERGLLTVGIVTIPFLFEGQVKIKKALAGADEMAKYVDALLVINNERLTEIYGDLDFINAFGKADDTLTIAASSISEIITSDGQINLDFNDVDTTLRSGGAAIISTGYGEGEGRVSQAIRDALNSPLLKNRDILGSKKLLFNLYFSRKAENTLKMSESNELREFINSINADVDVIWGICYDDNLGEKVKITILAAGFDVTLRDEEEGIMKGENRGGNAPGPFIFDPQPREPRAATPPPAPKPQAKPLDVVTEKRIAAEYGQDKVQEITGAKDRSSSIILGMNQLDDDSICEILENNPTFKRERRIIESVKNLTSDATASAGTSGAFFSYNG